MGRAIFKKRLAIASLILFLAFGITVYIKGRSFAADSPHDASNATPTLRVYCSSCHSAHRAAGTSLIKDANNVNLCISCHTSGGIASTKRLHTTMQAAPGTSGTSHRWDRSMAAGVAPLNLVAGSSNNIYGLRTVSELPTVLRSKLGAYGNVMACSVCHNHHGQAKTPWDPYAPASGNGRHFQRTANDLNQMCEVCHAYRAMSYTGARGDDGSANGTKKFSHPVGEVLNSQGYDKTAPLDYDGTVQQTAPRYHENSTTESPANSTNNLVLDSAGKIRCLSCHRIHYVDSNGNTVDAP